MNRESFLEATVSQVSQVYKGKRHHCRCGCGGTYTATSYMINPRSEVNDKLVARRLKQAQELIRQNAVFVDYESTYVDVETSDNRSLTFYFDEV